MAPRRFRHFNTLVLIATLGVIGFGAYVRASGSGAGCGSHWPTCNGEVIPRPQNIATVIEFTHRATSGVLSILVAAQLVWALKLFPRGHRARRAAGWSAVFLVSEALIGAGLVLFELVANDTSIARAASICAHLINTFLLLGSLTLTGFWAEEQPGHEPWGVATSPRGVRGVATSVLLGLLAIIGIGATGAVTALGDTLFPARSLSAGVASDFGAAAHLFERLRVVHPVLAVLGAVFLLVVASRIHARAPALRGHAAVVSRLVYVQLAVGVVNLWLLAPIATQLVHLLLADLLWMATVRLGAASQLASAPNALPTTEAPRVVASPAPVGGAGFRT